MRRFLGHALLLSLALTFAGGRPLSADDSADAKAFLEKFDAMMYYPQDHGLKDFSCSVDNSMFKMSPMTAKMKITLYWKSPNLRAAKVEGLDDSNPMMAQMKSQMKHMTDMVVRERYTSHLQAFDYTMTKDGDRTKLVGTRRKDAPSGDDLPPGETFWFDGQGRLVEAITQGAQGAAHLTDMTYTEKDGQLMFDGMKMSGEGGGQKMSATMNFEYEQVGGIWLVGKLKQNMGQMKMDMLFTDYQVNTGLADSIFEEKEVPVSSDKGKGKGSCGEGGCGKGSCGGGKDEGDDSK